MDVRLRENGFRYLFSAEVAVRPHTVDDMILMECKPARFYLHRGTNFLHAVEPYLSETGEDMMRTVFDEDLHHLGSPDEPLCAPRDQQWIGLVSTGQSLVFISAKIRAAQEARENGLWWQPEDSLPPSGEAQLAAEDF